MQYTSSYSKKESEPNDVFMHFDEYSNKRDSDRSSNANQSNFFYKNRLKYRSIQPHYCRIAKRSIDIFDDSLTYLLHSCKLDLLQAKIVILGMNQCKRFIPCNK